MVAPNDRADEPRPPFVAPEQPTTPKPEYGPAPPSSCANGLGLLGSFDVQRGAPAFFYEDRPSLAMTGAGAAYVYLDHDGDQTFVARLDASGAPQSVRKIDFPDKHERSHVVAAVHGRAVVVALAVYHAEQEADIELTLLDDDDQKVWTTRVDPSPDLDGTPAIAWGTDEIAVAWTRGPYPTADRVLLAFVDPRTGKVKRTHTLASGGPPGVPSIVWDGEAFWIAWQKDVYGGGGIQVVRAAANGTVAEVASIAGGENPFLLPTPEGMAVAYDEGGAIWFTVLAASGATKLSPRSILVHPDPIATPRKPILAFDGKRFAVAYEVLFHASVMIAREPEARIAVVEPNGMASPSIRLHPEKSAGEMPAVAWTGKDWLVVYNRDRLQRDKTPQVVAARVACLTAPPREAATPQGPCDVRSKPAPAPLQIDRRKTMMAVVSLDDGGHASLQIPLRSRVPVFVRVDRHGKTIARVPLRVTNDPRHPVLVRRPAGFVAAWTDDIGTVEVVMLDESGKRSKRARLPGESMQTSTPGLAWTPRGVVVAYGSRGGVVTALLDEKANILSPPAPAAQPPFPAGDCSLGRGPHGLLLAFSTGTDRTESNVIRVMRLDDGGKSLGPVTLVTEPYTFLREPAVIGTNDGFLLAATGPFSREVVAIELGPTAEVVKPERELLTSYGYVTFGAFLSGTEARVFGFEATNLQERTVCR